MPPIPSSMLPRQPLGNPHIRVLWILYHARGPLTKTAISELCGHSKPSMVGKIIGYSDFAKRSKFERSKSGGGTVEKPYYSLLSLGYVSEIELDIDGLYESAISITELGKKEFERLKIRELPQLKSRGA